MPCGKHPGSWHPRRFSGRRGYHFHERIEAKVHSQLGSFPSCPRPKCVPGVNSEYLTETSRSPAILGASGETLRLSAVPETPPKPGFFPVRLHAFPDGGPPFWNGAAGRSFFASMDRSLVRHDPIQCSGLVALRGGNDRHLDGFPTFCRLNTCQYNRFSRSAKAMNLLRHTFAKGHSDPLAMLSAIP